MTCYSIKLRLGRTNWLESHVPSASRLREYTHPWAFVLCILLPIDCAWSSLFGSSGGLPPQAGQFVRHRLHPLISFSAGGRFVFRSLLCRLARCNFRIRALRFSRSLLLCRLPRRRFHFNLLLCC